MLKNARLGVRIGAGFAVVLIMTVLVAVVGLYSMQRLQDGLFLADQADEVVAQVLRAREMEKEYVVSADRGAADNARERLDEVITVTKDMTARIANPQARELLGLIQEDVQEYQAVISTYVDMEEQRVQAGQSMEQTAQKLESVAQEILHAAQEKRDKVQAISAQRIEQAMEIGRSAGTINNLAAECRLQEILFVQGGRKANAQQVDSYITKISNQIQALKQKLKDQVVMLCQAENLEACLEEYTQGFEQYKEMMSQQAAAQERMDQAADKLVNAAGEIKVRQRGRLFILLADGARLQQAKARIGILDRCTDIVQMAAKARQLEKEYMVSQEEDLVTQVNSLFGQIQTSAFILSDEIQALAGASGNADQDVQYAENVADQAQKYEQAFGEYIQIDEQTQTARSSMQDAARRLRGAAESINRTQDMKVNKVRRESAQRQQQAAATAQEANQLIRQTRLCRQKERTVALTRAEKGVDEVRSSVQKINSLGQGMQAQGGDAQELGVKIVSMVSGYSQAFDAFVQKILAQKQAEERMAQAAGRVERRAAEIGKLQQQQMAGVASKANLSMLLGSAGAVGLGILLACLITLGVTRPMRRVIGQLFAASGQVNSASDQIARSSQQIAEGVNEQASSLEESSSSLEQMASQTKQNAEHANTAKLLRDEAYKALQTAVHAMQQTTAAMQRISTQGDEIGKIIKAIDDIAFQTNLLALNAAVEAARAGEAGKGFAVVAEEVRNLAQRSAQAAQDTQGLIEKTVNEIHNGSKMLEQTKEAFEQTESQNLKVGGLIDEIATASDEQAQGIEQVNTAVAEMDKVVQTSAADAEEAASVAEELSAQARDLEAVVQELMRVVGSRRADSGFRQESADQDLALEEADQEEGSAGKEIGKS